MQEPIRILFLAANPKDSSKLRLDEEIRGVHSKIRAAEFRDRFELVSRWAVRPMDLLQALNEVQPHIVHFSGHGCRTAGMILEDESGHAKPVGETALVALFRSAKDNIRLVVLNACHSESQASAISQEVECTVGMKVSMGDDAAIIFASNFYGALAFGRSVGQAFEQGRTALMLEGIPEENTPVLLTGAGIDALSVSFITRSPVNSVLPSLDFESLRSNAEFAGIANHMPELIAEMKQDLETEKGKFVREFFVLETRSLKLGGTSKPRFIYYEEEHPNLRGKLDVLENHGYLSEVTPKNTPIYRMTEEFVRLVLQWQNGESL